MIHIMTITCLPHGRTPSSSVACRADQRSAGVVRLQKVPWNLRDPGLERSCLRRPIRALGRFPKVGLNIPERSRAAFLERRIKESDHPESVSLPGPLPPRPERLLPWPYRMLPGSCMSMSISPPPCNQKERNASNMIGYRLSSLFSRLPSFFHGLSGFPGLGEHGVVRSTLLDPPDRTVTPVPHYDKVGQPDK